MSTSNKDFKVKNGLTVSGGGTFGSPVTVGTPTLDSHAATKAYVDANAGGGTPVTYSTSSASTTGGANIVLTGSDSSTDNLKVASTTNITVSSTDASTVSVDLDADIENINSITLDTTPGTIPTTQGTIFWDATNVTPAVNIDSNVTMQIGQELLAYVYNAESTTLVDGEVVYLYGAHGNRASVKRASASSESTSSKTVGVVTEPIASGANGFITIVGVVNGLNLGSFAEGDTVWLGTTAGTFTATKPVAPAHAVFVGVVAKANNGNGALFVRTQNGYELDELHNVLISTPADKNLLAYDSATGLWKNNTFSGLGLATLSSPALTGTPTAPTATAGTNTTQVATTAFVSTAVSNLVASAPSTLDTLNELATALGNDANFATTISTALGNKQPLDADLTAIAGLSGTSGFLKKTAADTWSLDTTNYVPKTTLVAYTSGTSITISDSSSTYVDALVNITSTSGAITITLNDSTYPVGTQMNFLRNTAQSVTFVSGTASVYATPGLKMRARYSMATLIKITEGSGSGDVWILTGDLTA